MNLPTPGIEPGIEPGPRSIVGNQILKCRNINFQFSTLIQNEMNLPTPGIEPGPRR